MNILGSIGTRGLRIACTVFAIFSIALGKHTSWDRKSWDGHSPTSVPAVFTTITVDGEVAGQWMSMVHRG